MPWQLLGNGVIESFLCSLKKERISNAHYKTRDMTLANVFDYIEVPYNRSRRHIHLGSISPEALEHARV